MKTAMQELIDRLKQLSEDRAADNIGIKNFMEKQSDIIDEQLEKEKEQIIHAFNCGESFSVDYFNPETPEVAPSVNYYIQSYQNK
jgi:hypothetical protein